MKKLLQDLLYTKGNHALDITRVSILFSIGCFWAGVFFVTGFDPIAVGSGAAALFAGAAGWLHFRQKQEGSDAPTDPSNPGA
jgi:hypothetical protein